MADRHYTMNGCYYTEPSIYPKNWKSGGLTSLDLVWKIQYYYFDPGHSNDYPYGKSIIIKGMNDIRDLHKRRAVTEIILEEEIGYLKRGYNKFSSSYMVDQRLKYGILHPHLKFIDAFRIAANKLKRSKKYIYEIICVINRIEQAAIKLNMTMTTIEDLKRRQLKIVLEESKFTSDYFNKARSYISTLFSELIEYECCESNLVRDIRKKKTVRTERELLTPDDMRTILSHLKTNYPSFYVYTNIFMLSGSRTTELFNLKFKDIDISNQEYKVVIKKRGISQEVTKVIIKQAVEFWKRAVKNAEPEDYIFSKGLVPGPESIDASQITKRWYRLVKKSKTLKNIDGNKLNITADFYSFKHSFLDSLPTAEAQLMAEHLSSKTTEIYQVNKKKRERELLKQLIVNFE